MLDASWLKVHDAANDLQSRSRNKNGNDGADADGAIQSPADEQNHADNDGLHQTDGMIWEPLAQGYRQRIPWATALPCGHIKILPEPHHEQPDNNKKDAQPEAMADGDGVEIPNPIDIIANQEGIQHGAKADFFLQEQVNPQNDDAADGVDEAEAQPDLARNCHGKTFPWGNADIRLHGQIDTAGIKKQPKGRF